MQLQEIGERTFGDDEGLQLFEYLAPRGRNKSVAHSGYVDQIVSLVIANDDGVESVGSGDEASDHQFLTAIHAILDLTSRSESVNAIPSLSHDPLELLPSNCVEQIGGRNLDTIRNTNSGRGKFPQVQS